MLTIAAIACALANPQQCKPVELHFAEDGVTPYQCLMRAQIELAKWTNDHPDWRITRYTCEDGTRHKA